MTRARPAPFAPSGHLPRKRGRTSRAAVLPCAAGKVPEGRRGPGQARLLALATMLALAACKAGPNYTTPTAITSPAFKEAALFRPAVPADATERGPWWQLFADPDLDRLATQVATANQDVITAEATYRQALGLVREQRAALFPTIGVSAGYTRTGSVGSGGRTTVVGGAVIGGGARSSDSFRAALNGSWTPDLFGGVRRGIEQARANADASAADLANMRLALQGELVVDYLQLRAYDAERVVVDDTITAYRRDLAITRNRYAAGVAGKSDVLQAETQLLNAQVTSVDLGRQRGILEHAIAVLTGAPPAALTLAPRREWTPRVPAPPPGLPSTLLERRPDIAAAERRVAAASAGVGVQVAAYFPAITLSASTDQNARTLGDLFASSANLFTLGATISQTLFDFGARRARVAQARAALDRSVAQYRSVALGAFREVEDQLLSVTVQARESALRTRAAAASTEAEQIALNQYKAGTIAFTDVIVTQTTALNARRAAIQTTAARQAAAAQLIQALGGGWSVARADPPVR